MRANLYILAGIICLAATGGCKKKVAPSPRPPVPVKVAVAGDMAEVSGREYSATLQAGTETPLSFTVAGTVRGVNVGVGDHVSRGQTIATIDDTSLRNTLAIAQAEEEQALDAMRRLKILHDAKALAEIKWVDIQAKVKQAKAATAIARRGLGNAILTSPVSGVVAQKLAEPGATAMPGVPVVTILSGNDLQAMVTVPENEINNFNIGDMATITAQNGTFKARLAEKGVQADPLTRNYTTKWRVEHPDAELMAGMLCTLRPSRAETAQEVDNPIILPIEAVMLKDDNSKMVWVVKKGVARPRDVEAGSIVEDGVEITRGLSPGDSVIKAGQENVGSGARVKINK